MQAAAVTSQRAQVVEGADDRPKSKTSPSSMRPGEFSTNVEVRYLLKSLIYKTFPIIVKAVLKYHSIS